MKINPKWLIVTKTKSSGPGGQNVNKINSKICMKLPLFHLSPEIQENISLKYRNKINSSRELYTFSDKLRSQGENFRNCLEKLQDIIDNSLPFEAKPNAAKTEKIEKFKQTFERNRKKSKMLQSLKKFFRSKSIDY
jgi:peptidyl-tRNA hydrolase ICT1